MGPAAGIAGADAAWRETVSPHFRILYRTPFVPPGLALDLEKLHNRMRLDLSMFSPWMEKERVTLYLYPDRKSYLEGEYKPPEWSTGLAFYQHRLLAVYDVLNHRQLMHAIAHEMTHLLFESYWGEVGRMPPQWLNEGLAMMEENEGGQDSKNSDWSMTLSTLSIDQLISFGRFTEIVPVTDLTDKKKVAVWYLEAYAAVYYLYRAHTRLQFTQFCQNLRDRKTIDQSLWTSYRFRDSQAFEKAWKDWLGKTFHMPAVGASGMMRTGSDAPQKGKQESENSFPALKGTATSPRKRHSGQPSPPPKTSFGDSCPRMAFPRAEPFPGAPFHAIDFPQFNFHSLRGDNNP